MCMFCQMCVFAKSLSALFIWLDIGKVRCEIEYYLDSGTILFYLDKILPRAKMVNDDDNEAVLTSDENKY